MHKFIMFSLYLIKIFNLKFTNLILRRTNSVYDFMFRHYSFKASNSKNLGPYLAGLIEGDGHIYGPKSTDRKNLPNIEIAFDIKDKPLI